MGVPFSQGNAVKVFKNGVVSCIGFANFIHRSMLKDDGVNLVALSEELAENLVTHFNEDLEHCKEIKKGTWKPQLISSCIGRI